MRQIVNPLFCVFLLFLLLSCSSDSPEQEQKPEPEPVPEPTVQDTYGYIFVQNDGQLFEIGNKSGEITRYGQISGIEFNTVLNAVTSSGEKFYVYEHEFDPFQGFIHVYDPSTKTSKAHPLNLAAEVFGENAGLVSLEWDEANKNLLALVQENFEEPGSHTGTVARIDPATFEVSSTGIKLEEAHISSTALKGNELFISLYSTATGGVDDLIAVNLNSGAQNSVERFAFMYAPIHLSADNSSDKLFGFFPYNYEFMGASEPVLIDPVKNTIELLLHDELTGNLNQMGRSFYNAQTQEHVDLITAPKYHALFRYNLNTGEVNITKIPVPNDMSSLITIVGAVKKS